jgi:predicted dehydrogenase
LNVDVRHRVAIVGTGAVSALWFPPLLERQDTRIVAVVDVEESFAHAALERHGVDCPVFRGIADAIAATAPTIVVNLTPPEHHRAVVGTALQLGCDVLGEKPMAAALDEALELVTLAEATGRTYAVMQQRRYVAGIRALRDGIAAGRIGRPELICADYYMAPHFGGFRAQMENPLLLDMAIHTFDQMRFITALEPIAVTCHAFNPPSSRYRGAAAAIVLFECGDGAVFSYRGSWAAEGFPTPWEAVWRVTGARGTALWDGSGAPTAETAEPPTDTQALFSLFEQSEWTPTYTDLEGHSGCIDAVFGALARGARPETDCADNVKSLTMVSAALASARRGGRVVIADHVREAAAKLS